MRRTPFFILLAVWVAILAAFLGNPVWAQESDEDREPSTIQLDPTEALNPVKTQHTFVATVLDKKGRPVAGQRVDWILARGKDCVGDIVEHDDMDAIIKGSSEVVRKLGNQYTRSYTNPAAVVLTMGTPDKTDDIELKPGQTWITITSPLEGETHVIAFCPSIRNANRHKAFAIKTWMDAKILWPENATNKVGTPHQFKFKLVKASTDVPIVGYAVNWKLDDEGIPAYLGDNPGTKVVATQTNEEGEATVVLKQVNSVPGQNIVRIELRNEKNKLLATRKVVKTWVAPSLAVKKVGPAEGIVGEKVVYTIDVSNPGDADAQEVVLKDKLPDGMSYLDCTLAPTNTEEKELVWNLGVVPKDATKKMTLTLKAEKEGEWVNTASIMSKETAPQHSQWITKVGKPVVFIVKEAPEEVRLGEKITYKLTIKNNGNAVAKNLLMRDFIPAGLKFQNRTEGVPLKWDFKNLEAGKTQQVTYTVDTIKTGTFTNEAEAYLGTEVVHKTVCKTRVVAPDLKLSKEGPKVVYLHRNVEFTIIIRNDGDGSAKDVEVVDMLPRHLAYTGSNPRGSFKPGSGDKLATVTWQFKEIAPKQTVEIKLETRAQVMDRCQNVVKLVSKATVPPQIPPLEAIALLEIRGIPAMHISTYDTEDPVEVGKQTIYVVETRNEGTSHCTNVVMKSRLPEEMEFISANGPTPFKVDGLLITFEAYPILPPGEKLTYKVVCKATKPGSAKHAAILKYDQFDKEITDEEGTSVYR